MHRVIVGTAGHVDHGKTALIEALTGIDCDRWAEEKARGITIDLGFAHLEQDDVRIGFVDVPGHQKFLHNALAGLGGIRIVLLVVAADEGIKPQSREHLAICSLLEIPTAVVALSKSDLVSADRLHATRNEVATWLATTPFQGAPVLSVSATNGSGILELSELLIALARDYASESHPEVPARLPIDRAFQLKGLGLIVTGTLISGRIQRGDKLEILPGGGEARVRGLQIHGKTQDYAEAGDRTALQLAGPSTEDLPRGAQLVRPDSFRLSNSLLVKLRLLEDAPGPMQRGTECRVHLFSGECLGRARPLDGTIQPGAQGLVEIRLARPVVAVRGDRCILRRPSPATTLGGGRILDPQFQRRRGKTLRRALQGLTGSVETAIETWIDEAGEQAATVEELAARLGLSGAEVGESLVTLQKGHRVLRVPAARGHGERWLAPGAYRRVAERTRRTLEELFARDRLATGMSKAEAVEKILPGGAAVLAETYFAWLAAQKQIAIDGTRVTLPGRAAQLTGTESTLAQRLQSAFEAAGLTPPSPREVAAPLNAKSQIVDGVLNHLVESGALVKLPGGLVLSSCALDRLRADLAASGLDNFSVGQFKEQFDLSRKWAIPLLEHLDSVGITRRVGDLRQLIRTSSR